MPPVVAAGAAIAGAVGTAATAAVGALSAVGLANGLMLAGTGLSLIGKATGSKTLSNIGLGFSAAGGVTGLATGFGAKAASDVADDAVGAMSDTKVLGKDSINKLKSTTIKGAKSMNDLKSFKPSGVMTDSMDSFAEAAKHIGSDPLVSVDNTGFLQRAGDTLRKYDTTANVLMGMGNAYMSTRSTQAQEDMFDKRLDFEREQIERRERNYGTPSKQFSIPSVQRVPSPVTSHSLLRRN